MTGRPPASARILRPVRTEPFATSDAAWLGMEHPTNLMMVTAVLTFEGRLDPAALRRIAEQRPLRHARSRRRAVRSLSGRGPPVWEPDPPFALDAHLHRVALPAPGGRPGL